MAGHRLAFVQDQDTVHIAAYLRVLARLLGRHAVLVPIHCHQAGLGHPCPPLGVAIEGRPEGAQGWLLFLEDLPNAALLQLGVGRGLCALQALLPQPGIELVDVIEARRGGEEPRAQHIYLVLDLPLLPAGGYRAGGGIDQIVIHQRQEPRIELPILPLNELAVDHVDDGLGVV